MFSVSVHAAVATSGGGTSPFSAGSSRVDPPGIDPSRAEKVEMRTTKGRKGNGLGPQTLSVNEALYPPQIAPLLNSFSGNQRFMVSEKFFKDTILFQKKTVRKFKKIFVLVSVFFSVESLPGI